MERTYNDTAQKIGPYINHKMTPFEQMNYIKSIHFSEKMSYRYQKRTKFPISDKKEKIRSEEQKMTSKE